MKPCLFQLITIVSTFFLVRYLFVWYNTLLKGFDLFLNYVFLVNMALNYGLTSDSIQDLLSGEQDEYLIYLPKIKNGYVATMLRPAALNLYSGNSWRYLSVIQSMGFGF